MTAYYNEIEPYCAEWLRNLMHEGLIADGYIDTRSIQDVTPNDLAGFTQCHFFAGLGGWSGALRLAAWPDHRPVWTGSCPCQPFSLAGRQGGFADARHLWPAFRYLIAQRGPPVVFGEQVASASQWLGLVRGDLEALGYAVGCLPVQAASAGADHLRDRYWFVADADSEGLPERIRDGRIQSEAMGTCAGETAGSDGHVADTDQSGVGEERQQRGRQLCGTGGDPKPCDSGDVADSQEQRRPVGDAGSLSGTIIGERPAQQFERCRGNAEPGLDWVVGADGKARRVKPGIRLLAHGIPNRVAKLRALGNAIDLRPAAEFIKAVMGN